MARPKGTGKDDKAALQRMAELLVSGNATSKREAANMVLLIHPPLCSGKTHEAIRQRLCWKYNRKERLFPQYTRGELLESSIRRRDEKIHRYGPHYEQLEEMVSALAQETAKITRLREWLEGDSESMEVIKRMQEHPDEIMDYLPDLLYYTRNQIEE